MNRNDPRVSCEGKDKLTASRAREVAKRLVGKTGNAYHCVHCKSWHVGHINHRVLLAHKRPRFYDNDGADEP